MCECGACLLFKAHENKGDTHTMHTHTRLPPPPPPPPPNTRTHLRLPLLVQGNGRAQRRHLCIISPLQVKGQAAAQGTTIETLSSWCIPPWTQVVRLTPNSTHTHTHVNSLLVYLRFKQCLAFWSCWKVTLLLPQDLCVCVCVCASNTCVYVCVCMKVEA